MSTAPDSADRQRFDQIVKLLRTGDPVTAEAECRAVLTVRADDRNFMHLLGIVLAAQNKHDDAVVMFRRCLEKKKEWPEAIFNLGQALLALGAKDEARTSLRRLVKEFDGHKQHYVALAKAEQACGDMAAAKNALLQAARLDPNDREVQSWTIYLARQICDWDHKTVLDKILPSVLVTLTDDPARVRFAAEHECQERYKNIKTLPPVVPVAKPRLKIGYLSSDFHDHATAYLMAELFSLHNHNEFEVFVYSYGPDDGSAIRKRIAESADEFIDVSALTAFGVANRIRQDGIDILIDLKGHTRGGKLEILARRPAPLQMHWLGYPGTTGATFIDYFIADGITLPEESEKYFTEKILRLPNSYQINDRQRPVPSKLPREIYGFPADATVLACFNQSYKITAEQLNVWMSLFRELPPDTILWLYESNPEAKKNILAYAEKNGLAHERIYFAQPTNRNDHLARYHHVDIAIDTFPVGGHTTTSDALWMGTPVITRMGNSFISRAAASLLEATGLHDLVTEDTADYRAKILELGNNIEERQRIRALLTERRYKLPLFDTPRFVHNLEVGLHMVWDKAVQGSAPATINVREDTHI